MIYGRLDVITSSDKQTEAKFGQQDHCCKASAYPYRSMLKTWLANKMKSSRIWGREGWRERVVATSWRPGNGRGEILRSIFPLTKVEHVGRPRGEMYPFLNQLQRQVLVLGRCLISLRSSLGIFRQKSVKNRVNLRETNLSRTEYELN